MLLSNVTTLLATAVSRLAGSSRRLAVPRKIPAGSFSAISAPRSRRCWSLVATGLLRGPLLLLPLVVLAACDPALGPGPRIALVGSTRFLSANRRLTIPGDTVTTKLYASTAEQEPLTQVRISVTFTPKKEPLDRSALQASNTLYRKYPKDSVGLVYLDTMLSKLTREFVFQSTVGIRTTPGRETWTYEATDANNRTSRTSIVLALAPNTDDSTLLYHRYTVRLQTPREFDSRPYLALLPGLTFPRYSARMSQGVQQLIDLIYLPGANNGVVLASPADQRIPLAWPGGTRRSTRLRAPVPALDLNGFNAADTNPELTGIFNSGAALADTLRTSPLVKGQIIAFRTADQKSGLIYVDSFVLIPVPSVVLQVHIQK